jgi:hypothetical protein
MVTATNGFGPIPETENRKKPTKAIPNGEFVSPDKSAAFPTSGKKSDTCIRDYFGEAHAFRSVSAIEGSNHRNCPDLSVLLISGRRDCIWIFLSHVCGLYFLVR